MQTIRFFPSELSVFKTFTPLHPIQHLDIRGKAEAFSLLEQLPEQGFAVVGSRYPQRRSVEILEDTFIDLQKSRLIIISGLARGIDSRAHELALEHGLKTIAILGCGINVDYPKENAYLKRRILDAGGLIISPFENDAAPLGYHFLHRNQLIAGFAKATWVVEAAAISGTLNTAKWATDYNRELYATSSFPNDPFFQGNEKLLSQRHPDRYPLAHPFFNALSLTPTWPQLASTQHSLDELVQKKPTEIQSWILELKSQWGECHVQTLMNLAHSKGHSLGEFVSTYEKELLERRIIQDEQGRVDVLRPDRESGIH